MNLRLLVLALALAMPAARADEERFDIRAFTVEGNTLLPQDLVDDAVRPYAGSARSYADVERAREALELKYRQAGFGTVLAHVPEQELTQGVVRLQVIESRIRQVGIVYATPDGGQHFSEDNVRASLPSLRIGGAPNTPAIADNIQLANENPAKQVDVVLKAANELGAVDAEITVAAGNPRKFFLTLDNTGNSSTGEHRLGVGFQHANVFDRDHVATFNYATSPEKPSQVSLYSVSYRLPLYGQGDSVDLILAQSDVNAGSTPTVAGLLTFTGKGEVYGLRYNYLLHRRGEYAHRIIAGLDYRAFDNTCNLGSFGSAGCGPSGVDVTVRPVSVTYAGQWQKLQQAVDFAVSYAHNWPGAKNGQDADFALARPATNGSGGASADYGVMRANASYLSSWPGDWQLRAAGSLQYAFNPLIAVEQFGLTGAATVRGFNEREAARDSGYVANLEAYSPNWAPALGIGSNLRALAFYDRAGGRNRTLPGDSTQSIDLASAGVGLRLGLDKSMMARLDVATVLEGDGVRPRGQNRGHFFINYAF